MEPASRVSQSRNHLKLLNDSTQMLLLLSSHLEVNGGQLTVLKAEHQIYGFGCEL